MDMQALKQTLEKKGYRVSCFETKEEAAAYLDREIDAKTVGIGGAVTVQQMQLTERLRRHNEVFWHWEGGDRYDAMATDVYLSSVNGLAMTGELVNIDGNGNRVASTLFGHKKVYFIVGSNKIAEDLDGAIWRARNIAAPLNAIRLGLQTPCAAHGGGKCFDCKSPQRICKALTVFWEKPTGMPESEIVLVNEALGY